MLVGHNEDQKSMKTDVKTEKQDLRYVVAVNSVKVQRQSFYSSKYIFWIQHDPFIDLISEIQYLDD